MRYYPLTSSFLSLLFLAGTPSLSTAQRGPVPGIDTTTPYLIYYGNWTPAQVDAARTDYELVILHPVSNITAADIATIQTGVDGVADTADDVLVLAYISVGEDNRTGAPVLGDGTGPRVDPRTVDTDPLDGIDPLGDPSPNGVGYASYYLDDTTPDGVPDSNAIFGSPYVNAGDPAWYQVLRNNTLSTDGAAGFEEILTDTVGNAYACDGVFLDTLDTCAPNSFGATLSEWTAPGYQTLAAQISTDYPSKIILGNRGLFFYNPNLKHYDYSLRPYLNMIMFESYYTDSSDANVISPFFDDNKFNLAPKLNAEAGRSDGFTIVCLGYDQPSNLSQTVKDQDYVESMAEQGWTTYRTDGSISAAFNLDASSWLSANPDVQAPVWDSTAATSADSDAGVSGNQAPTPRIGIQEAVAGDGEVTVRWDVARDQTGPVKYNIYYTTDSVMNFATATKLSAVSADTPSSYTEGTGSGVYPYEYTIDSLTNDSTYLFAVRAEDSSSASIEDSNTATLSAIPSGSVEYYATIAIDGDFSDWDGITPLYTDASNGSAVDYKDVYIVNDSDYVYVRFTLHSAAAALSDFNSHVFIDTDGNSETGLVPSGATFGSEVMIESGIGYDQRNGGFNEGTVSGIDWLISSDVGQLDFEFRVSRAALFADSDLALGSLTQGLRLLLQDNRGDSLAGVSGVEFNLAPTPVVEPVEYFATIAIDGIFSDWDGIDPLYSDPSDGSTVDFKDVYIANDADYVYVRFTLHSAAAAFVDFNSHVFIDADGSSATGYLPGAATFGSEVMIESGAGFDQRNGGFNEGSVSGLDWLISSDVGQLDYEFRISRSALYADSNFALGSLTEGLRLLLQDNRGDSLAGVSGVEFNLATGPVVEPVEYFATIVIDGAFSDWDGIDPLYTDPSDGTIVDFKDVYIANDADYVYARFTLYSAAAAFSGVNSHVFIDTDGSSVTGYTPGLADFGSEFFVEAGAGFDQRAGGFNEGSITGLDWLVASNAGQLDFELRISRSALYADNSPVFGSLTEGLRLLLQDNQGGSLAGDSGVRFNIAATPSSGYQSWKLTTFTSLQLADVLVSGDEADPDEDGIANLLEFGLGLDPFVVNSGALLVSSITNESGSDYLEISYTRLQNTGLTFLIEQSSDLDAWDSNVANFTELSVTDLGNGSERVTTRVNAVVSSVNSPLFVRLSLSE